MPNELEVLPYNESEKVAKFLEGMVYTENSKCSPFAENSRSGHQKGRMLWAIRISYSGGSRGFESGLHEFDVSSVILKTPMIWDNSIHLVEPYSPL